MASGSTFVAGCGIRIASSALQSTVDAVAELRARIGSNGIQHVVVFFSVQHDPGVLASAMDAAFAEIPVSGCSTAGEITPLGLAQGSILAIAFPKDGFRVRTGLIEDIDQSGVERANEIVRRLKNDMMPSSSPGFGDRVFALMLVDGLSNAEERLVAAVHWAMDDVHLIGGSAGDGLKFNDTTMIYGGRPVRRSAVLIMVESEFSFRVFKTEHFEPTATKLVVTAADTENRIVYELNAEPAAREYAAAIGLLPDELGPFSFASYPLIVRVGGNYYCRSIRNMNPDGSLSFFCAIDEGLVFTVAQPQDVIKSTEAALREVDKSLGGIDIVLGFDCILRRLDCEARQNHRQMEALYQHFRVMGFHTYGEQFKAMHLNQTLTGIAFGARTARENRP